MLRLGIHIAQCLRAIFVDSGPALGSLISSSGDSYKPYTPKFRV